MSFTRTRSGLSNLHLFYDSDWIVFTEGGTQTLTLEEVEKGEYNKSSVDIKFWKNVLEIYGFDKKINFRAIGSKTASESICEKIVNGEINNIIVAKDKDLDHYCGNMFNSPFILYTKGYSWENDVFIQDLTSEQIESMLLMSEVPEEINTIIHTSYSKFERVGKSLAKLEIMFRQNGIRFISNINGERFFNSKKSPFINSEQILSVLKEKKEQLKKPRTVTCDGVDICPYFSNYGKLLEALSITIISYVCRNFCNHKSIPKDIITTAMLERFFHKLRHSRDTYYYNLVSNLQSSIN